MELNLITGSGKRENQSISNKRKRIQESDEEVDNQSLSWSKKKSNKSNIDNAKRIKGFSERVKIDSVKTKAFVSFLFSGNPEVPSVNLKSVVQKKEPVFSVNNIKDADLHPHLISCLKQRLSIDKFTSVQQATIPVLLSGKDALVKSQTGSGKTLAYAIPIIQNLQAISPPINRSNGIHAVVILPTRELALQTYELFCKLTYSFTRLVPGCLCGGEKKKSEKARIRKGICILISTPGRLVDHIKSTSTLDVSKTRWLILDEADRLLDMGYEKDVTVISDFINEKSLKKTTVMLSATLTAGVEKLANLNMTDPEIIDISSEENSNTLSEFVTPSSLKHFFSFVPAKVRFVTLVSIICEKCIFNATEQAKCVVFFPTLSLVKYHFDLLQEALLPILSIDDEDDKLFFHLHGDMKQTDRVKVFNEFRDSTRSVLLTTDVAARGLELPNVCWIIQTSAPSKTEDYIHRVGRTARIGSLGHALTLLLPSEKDFVNELESHNFSLQEIEYQDLLKSLLLISEIPADHQKKNKTAEDQANNLQLHFEKCILENKHLHELGKDAFLSYVRSYASYPVHLRKILPFKELHLGHISKSLCLRDSPKSLGAQAYLMKQNKDGNFNTRKFGSAGQQSKIFRYEAVEKPKHKMTAIDTV